MFIKIKNSTRNSYKNNLLIDKYSNTNDTWGSARSNLKQNSFLTQIEEDLMAKLIVL